MPAKNENSKPQPTGRKTGATVAAAPTTVKNAPAKSAATKMRITRRILSSKRHTLGYVVGGTEMTVTQVRNLVKQNRISGVRVVGDHIQAAIGARPLYNLPATIRSNKTQ